MTTTFQFWSLPEEEQERLRDDEQWCIRLLQASKTLATKLAVTRGILTPLTEDDERRLQGFHLVQQAYQGDEYELMFDQLTTRAGLLPSDVGLLEGRVEELFRERQPVVYQAEAIALMEQWLRDQDAQG
jgi:hypothetical protein